MRILLVDDDAFLREMYTTKFAEHGHTVSVANNGESALDTLKSETFDVVLFDMVMPNLSGSEFLDETKKLQLNPSPKFIVLSNQGEEANIEEARSAGAAGYIVKAELIPSEVVTKIEELAGS